MIEKLYKKHKQWVEIVQSFGCNIDTAEDLVQEMYLKIIKMVDKGTDIMYNDDEINYYYIFRTLNSLFLDLKRKEKKVSYMQIDDYQFTQDTTVNYDVVYELVEKKLDEVYWYDKKVYEIVQGGESISKLADKTNISYYSLYNTYRKVKNHLLKIIKTKYE